MEIWPSFRWRLRHLEQQTPLSGQHSWHQAPAMVRCCLQLQRPLVLGPRCPQDCRDLMILHVGQAREHIAQTGEGIKAAPPAAFDQGINDGAALAGIGFPDEEPVFLADGSRPNGIFHQVVVDLHPTIAQINFQRAPLAQRIVNGAAQWTLGQLPATGFEF